MEDMKRSRLYSRPRNTRQWCEYFRANASSTIAVDPNGKPELSPYEREAVADSICEFQLGENAEGKHLYQAAKDYARESGDLEYVEAMAHLIKEEQRHAGYLRSFLTIEGIGLKRKTKLDGIFRKLRKMANLEVAISVLITAEIIAKVYYPAIGRATGSALLQRLCVRIEQEEIEHVIFQSERLALIRKGRSAFGLMATRLLHEILFFATCILVWPNHASAMRLGGLDFRGYLSSCRKEFKDALSRMSPENYESFVGRRLIRGRRVMQTYGSKIID